MPCAQLLLFMAAFMFKRFHYNVCPTNHHITPYIHKKEHFQWNTACNETASAGTKSFHFCGLPLFLIIWVSFFSFIVVIITSFFLILCILASKKCCENQHALTYAKYPMRIKDMDKLCEPPILNWLEVIGRKWSVEDVWAAFSCMKWLRVLNHTYTGYRKIRIRNKPWPNVQDTKANWALRLHTREKRVFSTGLHALQEICQCYNF